MKIAAKIEEIRKSKNISAAEMAGVLGITVYGYYNAIRTDNFKVSQLEAIAAKLDVEPVFFFNNQSDKYIIDLFTAGLNESDYNTENNPGYNVFYNYVSHQYIIRLSSFFAILNFGAKFNVSKKLRIISEWEDNLKNKGFLIVLREWYNASENKAKFIADLEASNDFFTELMYADAVLCYLQAKEILTPVLLTKILNKVVVNTSVFS
jgi:transcriptional regulator with XRE-family HTH domain